MPGPLLIFIAALLWSAGGLGIKVVDASPFAVSGWRSAFTIPILLYFCGRRLAAFRPSAPLLLITVAYAITLLTLVAATKAGTAAAAILLQYTAPLWLVPLGCVMPAGDRPTRRDLLVAAVCMVGVGLFFVDVLGRAGPATAGGDPAAGGGSLLGVVLGLSSGLAFALLTSGLRWNSARGADGDSVSAVLGGNVLIALVCLPAMIDETPRMNQHPHWWLILAGLGTFQIGAAYLLYAYAVRTVPAMRATLIAMAEPVLNPVWVAIGTGEQPGVWTIAGGAVLLATLATDAAVPRAGANNPIHKPAQPHAPPVQ